MTIEFFSITANFSSAIFSIVFTRNSLWSKPIFPIAIIGLDSWAVVASNRPPKPASRMSNSTFSLSKKFSAQQMIFSKGVNSNVEKFLSINLKIFSKSVSLIFFLLTLILSHTSKR